MTDGLVCVVSYVSWLLQLPTPIATHTRFPNSRAKTTRYSLLDPLIRCPGRVAFDVMIDISYPKKKGDWRLSITTLESFRSAPISPLCALSTSFYTTDSHSFLIPSSPLPLSLPVARASVATPLTSNPSSRIATSCSSVKSSVSSVIFGPVNHFLASI